MRRRIRIRHRETPAAPPRTEERASGAEAIEALDAREAETTPSHMNRLKTSRL